MVTAYRARAGTAVQHRTDNPSILHIRLNHFVAWLAICSLPHTQSSQGTAGRHGGTAGRHGGTAGRHGGTAGRHGGTAPTVSRDTRRDWPPCPSGLRANMFRRRVTRPKHPAAAQPGGPARGPRPLRYRVTLVGTGPRARPGCALTCFVAGSPVPNTLPPRNPAGRHGARPLRYRVTLVGTGPRARPGCALNMFRRRVTRPKHPAAAHPAGRHGGTAPTVLRDTRRDWPPCPSGLRANMFRRRVTRPKTLPPRTRRAGTGARPLRSRVTLVGTGPRACPGCARTCFVAWSPVPNTLPPRDTAGRHGGTAPATAPPGPVGDGHTNTI